MLKYKLKSVLILLIASIGAYASAKPIVITSTPIISDIAQNIAGDTAEIKSLIKKDADPHDFQPSIKDAVSVKKASLVLVNGLELEGWLDKFISSAGYTGDIVTVSDGIKVLTEDNHPDPHAWNSAKNGIIYTKNISKALIKLMPESKELIENNTKQYIEKLTVIDKNAKKSFAEIPKEKRKLISEHDAFSYFAKEYDIDMLAPLGLNSESETSAGNIAQLIEQIKKENVKYYFTEDQLQNKLAKQIADATGAQFGGNLYPETLTDEKGPASTYIDALEFNISTILKALKN